MYENPNVTERYITVLFTFASDDENDALMRDALTRRIEETANAEGCDVEIHQENILAEPVT